MSDDTRQSRFQQVAQARLGHVRCALETVHHRHNASAVLRSCDAFGVHRVHLIGERHFTPSHGTSKGANRWLDLRTHEDPQDAIRAIQDEGVALWIADLSPTALSPAEVPLDRPICLWFGAEVLGVCDAAKQAADGVVSLPMRGFAQSLNVSVAAALILRELSERARRELGADALLSPEDATAVVDGWLARDRILADEQAQRVDALATLGRALPDPR